MEKKEKVAKKIVAKTVSKPKLSNRNDLIAPEIIPVMTMEFPKTYNPLHFIGEPNVEGSKELLNEGIEVDQNSLNTKLDKITEYLNSIESELIELNATNLKSLHSPTYELIGADLPNDSLRDLSWETLFLLQKEAGDTIQRNNYPAGKYSPEMIFAQQRFESITALIKEKLKSISWD